MVVEEVEEEPQEVAEEEEHQGGVEEGLLEEEVVEVRLGEVVEAVEDSADDLKYLCAMAFWVGTFPEKNFFIFQFLFLFLFFFFFWQCCCDYGDILCCYKISQCIHAVHTIALLRACYHASMIQ